MRVAVLGPVMVAGTTGTVAVTPRQAREILTLLGLAHPRQIPLTELIDTLWDSPPATAAKTVQANLSRLRRALQQAGAAQGIAGGPAGYHVEAGIEVDTEDLAERVEIGRRALLAGTWTLAADALQTARSQLRGGLELPATAAAAAHRAWFDETRATLAEEHAEALLRGGRSVEVLAELDALIADSPWGERLWLLRVIALAQVDRFADALNAVAEIRRLLVETHGLDPGEQLRAAEVALLAGRVPELSALRRTERTRSASTTATREPATARPDIGYLDVGGVHVAWTCLPARAEDLGDLVLMLPGVLPVDSVLEEANLAAVLDELAEDARITWYDKRGVGLSDRCTADALPSVADWVDDLGAVLTEVGARRPVLLAGEDSVEVALRFAIAHPDRVGGLVLTNPYPRFTRTDDYPHGLDPRLADAAVAENSSATPIDTGQDLLTLLAPSVADDPRFRAWWDDAGRRGASPLVSRALRVRFNGVDIRPLLPLVTIDVLQLTTPRALAYDPGHSRYVDAHLPSVTTVALPGPDELWWLDRSGLAVEHIREFVGSRWP